MTLPDCARERCMPEIEFICQASVGCATCVTRSLGALAAVLIAVAHVWSAQAERPTQSRELTICDPTQFVFYALRYPSQTSWRMASIAETERWANESCVDSSGCAMCAKLCQVAQKA